MMICDADFDELFPPMAQPKRQNVRARRPVTPGKPCIARWEDDGGRTSHILPRRKTVIAHSGHHGYRLPDPRRASVAIAMMPAMAVYGAMATMLTAYGKITGA